MRLAPSFRLRNRMKEESVGAALEQLTQEGLRGNSDRVAVGERIDFGVWKVSDNLKGMFRACNTLHRGKSRRWFRVRYLRFRKEPGMSVFDDKKINLDLCLVSDVVKGIVTKSEIVPHVNGLKQMACDKILEPCLLAIDSTVIKLALSCIASYPYRSKKAAAKMHARLPIGSFIPSVVRIEAGKPHDSTMADGLTKDMKGGDILLTDRAYVDFLFLHNLTARDVFWVLRQKVNMLYEVVERREASGNIISDEVVRLTAANTAEKYPQTFRQLRLYGMIV